MKLYAVVGERDGRQYDLSGWVTFEKAEEVKGRALWGLPKVDWDKLTIVSQN